MKVLLVSDAQSIHTRRWAISLTEAGHEVEVASFRKYDIKGIKVHRLPTYGLGRLGYLFAIPFLRSLSQQFKPDVVHAQHVTSYGFLCAVSKLRPLVVTAWGSDVLISPQQSFILKFLVTYALKSCNKITTVAKHMNPIVEGLGISGDKIITIPFGVELSVFYPRGPLEKNNPIFKVISTRNFTPIYNVDVLITAVSIIKKRGISFQLNLVGSGPLRPELESQVASLGLENDVKFLGYVDHAVLPKLLSEADVFVTTALSDGNNISLNEAMACGTFPIATNIHANAQWITSGENGYLYEVGDANDLANALEKSHNDKNLRDKAVDLNLNIVANEANWSKSVLKMVEVYSSLSRG